MNPSAEDGIIPANRKVVKARRRLQKTADSGSEDEKENLASESNLNKSADNTRDMVQEKSKRSMGKPFKKRAYAKNYIDETPDETEQVTTPPQRRSRKCWETTPHTARESGQGWRSFRVNITPTENSTTISCSLSPIGPFSTTELSINPSTQGGSEVYPVKRRTYELEESIIDLTTLKSASKLDKNLVSKRTSIICISSGEEDTPVKALKQHSEISSVIKTASVKSKQSKVRVPNFAAIHQKAYEKMEDITSYKARKEARANFLLSGQKPPNESLKEKRTAAVNKKLRFAASVVEPSPPDIPLPNTPRPKNLRPVSLCSPLSSTKKSSANPKTILTPARQPPTMASFNTASSKKKRDTPKIFKSTLIPTFKKVEQKSIMTNAGDRKELCKTVISKKTNPLKDKIDDRRQHIKGVRSNRRFDLLMQMRNNCKD